MKTDNEPNEPSGKHKLKFSNPDAPATEEICPDLTDFGSSLEMLVLDKSDMYLNLGEIHAGPCTKG